MHICQPPSGRAPLAKGRSTQGAPEANVFAPSSRYRPRPVGTSLTPSAASVFQTAKVLPARTSAA